MIEKFLDAYDLKARIVPGLIIAVPVLIDGLYAAPVLNSWPIFATSGVVGFALVYALGQVARAMGEGIEAKLWDSWGGPPSTRFMRHRDRFFGENLKALIRKNLKKELSVELLSAEEESRNPAAADQAIADAFKQVRPYLRRNDPEGLWRAHNIEYGFARNLLGCRSLWVIIAAAAATFAVMYGIKTGKGPINPALTLVCIALVCAAYVGWRVLPGGTKRVADGYAESAWMGFLRAAEEKEAAKGSAVD